MSGSHGLWQKTGLIFSAPGTLPWMRSHASLPVALPLGGDLYRIYFASRDERNRSHVGFIEVDITDPARVIRLSDKPCLAPGPIGHFDEHGVYAASLVRHEGDLYLYYIGWNVGARPPLFYASIGLAISRDGGVTFEKYKPAPIMARSEYDPCLVTAPFVLIDNGKWRMWYVSGFEWREIGDSLHSIYHVKYAESDDGIDWDRRGLICIGLRPGEWNISRPCVIIDAETYKMWYGFNKGDGYRVGYAESNDGYTWERLDEAVGIGLSESGWDSEAMAYPWVFDHAGRKHMLYNGNGFGRTGLGLAVLVPPGG